MSTKKKTKYEVQHKSSVNSSADMNTAKCDVIKQNELEVIHKFYLEM